MAVDHVEMLNLRLHEVRLKRAEAQASKNQLQIRKTGAEIESLEQQLQDAEAAKADKEEARVKAREEARQARVQKETGEAKSAALDVVQAEKEVEMVEQLVAHYQSRVEAAHAENVGRTMTASSKKRLSALALDVSLAEAELRGLEAELARKRAIAQEQEAEANDIQWKKINWRRRSLSHNVEQVLNQNR